MKLPLRIFVLNGQGCSGKDTFKNFIIDYDKELNGTTRISTYSIIDNIKFIAKSCGWTGYKDFRDRIFLHDLKVLLDKYNDYPYKTVKNFINKINNTTLNGQLICPYIFIDIREIKDLERICKDFNCTTILIKRGTMINFGNDADDNVENWNYDYVVDNNGTLDDLKDSAITFWNSILREERIILNSEYEDVNINNINLYSS